MDSKDNELARQQTITFYQGIQDDIDVQRLLEEK